MATLDELKLQQLLRPFEGPGGIASLNPLAFQYQNQQYLNQDPTQDFYQPNNLSPTQDFYPLDRNPTQMFYQPRNFVNAPQDFYQPDLTTLRGLNLDRFQDVSDMSMIDETTNDEQDQNYIEQVEKSRNPLSGIMEILRGLPTPTNLLLNMLPKEDPRATNVRNFYGDRYGLTSSNSLASGIMKGYNPVYGNDFLNKISRGIIPEGGFGLANAARKRIERIANRKRAQTDASRAKIAELQRFAREDTANRARFDNQNVYERADKQEFTDGRGGGFGSRSTGTNENFSNRSGRGRTGY